MYVLKKEDLNRFAEHLISKYDVVAPVKKDIVRFSLLGKGDGDAGSMVFEQPLYPPKEFFLPLHEPFFHFRKGAIKEDSGKTQTKKTVFFMTRCDVNAVHRNDLILLDEPADPNYKERRSNAILIEIPCTEKETCFCKEMGNIDCYDIKMIEPEQGNEYLLDARTEKGRQLVEGFHLPKNEMKKEEVTPKKQEDIKGQNKDVWEQYGKECLSCSACTVVCPTCTCFTIDGRMELNCEEGHLYREWASCQLLEYTRVAGGFVFRKDRGARGRQRMHCKFQYFRDKYGYNRCVGCGRCNQACPVGINIFEYRSRLK